MPNTSDKTVQPFRSERVRSVNQAEFTDIIKKAIETSASAHRNSVVSLTVSFENTDPLAVLEILGNADLFRYYWEHPEDKLAISAGESICSLQAGEKDRFSHMSHLVVDYKTRIFEYSSFDHSLAGVHFLGGFSFFDSVSSNAPWSNFGTSRFVIPRWTFIRDGELSLMTINQKINEHADADSVCAQILSEADFYSSTIESKTKNSTLNGHTNVRHDINIIEDDQARSVWIENINRAKRLISGSAFKKIVLSRRIDLETSGMLSPTAMLNYLRKEYPSCYSFMFQTEDSSCFIGSSPEKLISIRKTHVLTEGLAGSISRGNSATQDTILEKKLLSSAKDLEEHNYVVDAIKERLSRFSSKVNLPHKPGIKKFTNVQHLYSPISATIDEHLDPFLILENLHPTPAVGGFPANAAVPFIRNLESYDRGWYASPIGWLNSKGRGEFIVAIRSGVLSKKSAAFYAGCGIVEDSDPELEWDETKLKLIPMLSAANHA